MKIGTLMTIVLFLICSRSNGQESTFDLKLLDAEYLDSTQQEVACVLVATPLGNKRDFPPVLSMKVGYRINDLEGYEFVDLQKQEKTKIQLIVYGETIAEKNPKLYDLIKDDIDIEQFEDILFVVLVFKQISKTPIKRMDIQYGLWEKRKNQRIEKEFSLELSVSP